MARRALLCAIVLAVLDGTTAGAGNAYLGLQPGTARRSDVARVLGPPTSSIGGLLDEHRPQAGTGPIGVEYQLGTDVVDRLEVKLTAPTARGELLDVMRLPLTAAGSTVSNGEFIEYFGPSQSVVLTYGGPTVGSGIVSVSYVSEGLFTRELARAGGTNPRDRPAPPVAAPASTNDGAGQPAARGGQPPVTPGGNTAPTPVARDPTMCTDVFLWADAEEQANRRGNQVARRQQAMGIRLAAQSGECDRARTLAAEYRRRYVAP